MIYYKGSLDDHLYHIELLNNNNDYSSGHIFPYEHYMSIYADFQFVGLKKVKKN